ncbi:TetR/AcrR family transcriptional regulator, partial [Streptomyces sp. NPDC021019]|uniref:TetR/AcrR family transcriptional regulator n=1 Tax=Streptomyces sp. NPDC021019 TaxID=3365108 RepID=UPI00379B6375
LPGQHIRKPRPMKNIVTQNQRDRIRTHMTGTKASPQPLGIPRIAISDLYPGITMTPTTNHTGNNTETTNSKDTTHTHELPQDTDHPRRGLKPGKTLNQIVETAIQIADTRGLEAVSMRRIATELGIGTMSLYRYIPNKNELLNHMLNHCVRTNNHTHNPTTNWRTTLENYARNNLALYRLHPWTLQISRHRSTLDPHRTHDMKKIISDIKSKNLHSPELVSVIIMIDSYVTGVAHFDLYAQEAGRRTGLTDSEFWAGQRSVLQEVMASGRFPTLNSLSEDSSSSDFDHFEFGLQRILDGLEAFVERRGRGSK